MDFESFVAQATGDGPYDYQARIARDGLPEALSLPTGSGKTMAAVLPWLWRRLDQRIEPTNRLVVVLPQRALVEQTVRAVHEWVGNLGLPVPVHVLMGGVDADDREWKTDPHGVRIFVGTQDMVLSRLLMRGYAENRAAWPMSFGVLHSGTQFVFDETQLMGPGLGTSLQLAAFRRSFGTDVPSRTMWMSATLGDLSTVDFTLTDKVFELEDSDREGELGRRLAARRTITELRVDSGAYAESVAAQVIETHQAGTRSLVVLNTVERAIEVYRALRTQHKSVVLLHSRFRPGDRRALTERIADAADTDQLVVSTQVLEAGVDISCRRLFTEVAPWTSIVQRAGRCNRKAEYKDAELCWFTPPGAGNTAPYEQSDVDAATEQLRALEGQSKTGEELGSTTVRQSEPNYRLLRRHHLVELFDTTPDLSGNDIDVGPFIRDTEDRTVFLAWRGFTEDEPPPRREELCPAPVGDVRAMAKRGVLRVYDQQAGKWDVAREQDVRPTALLGVVAHTGGYLSDIGFAPKSREPVEPVAVPPAPADAMTTDAGSVGFGEWYPLDAHAEDTERELRGLIEKQSVPEHIAHALALAARHHDLGKHHCIFQEALRKANPENTPDADGVFAKSPNKRRLLFARSYFRHELVSALLLRDGDFLHGVTEKDLIVYLALAHHGKVRVSVRPHVRERQNTARGVADGDRVEVAGTEYTLGLAATRLGGDSLTAAALRLRDRADIGPFRLAYYEALVRAADWRASSTEADADA